MKGETMLNSPEINMLRFEQSNQTNKLITLAAKPQ